MSDEPASHRDSRDMKKQLEIAALIATTLIAIAAALKSFALTPYRVDALEVKQERVTDKVERLADKQHELSSDIRSTLTEIRAGQAQFRRDIDEIKADLKAMRSVKGVPIP